MATQQSCAEAHCLFMTIVRARTEVDADKRVDTDILCQHIDGGAEGTGTIGRGTHTALYLHGLHTAGEITHIHPGKSCTLGIIHRDAVGGDVDTGRVCSTYPD